MPSIKYLWAIRSYIFAWFLPLVLIPIPLMIDTSAGKCAYVVLLMSLYWFTEAVPISVTALLPIVLFPLMGILSSEQTSKAYVNGTIMIFLGSLIAAAAVEKSMLHKRIALKVLLITGTSPKRLLFGFMFTTAFLSMWISNLASTALMIPIINAALDQLKHRKSKTYGTLTQSSSNVLNLDYKDGEHQTPIRKHSIAQSINIRIDEEETHESIKKSVYLGVCYAANVGGTGTLTGTSTNLVLNGILKENPVSFSDWMIFNIPGMFLLVFITWAYIAYFFMKKSEDLLTDEKDNEAVYKAIKYKYDELGSISFYESSVLVLFILLLMLWFFRDPDFMKGWALYISDSHNFIKDSAPALLIVILFFIIPAKPTQLNASPTLLDWRTTQDSVAWGIILLVGGGFAMAEGSEKSGLSTWMGTQLTVLERFSPFTITVIVCIIALLLTEIMSNTATCTVMLPVIKRLAIELGISPLSVMLPVTLVCSYAFMLPAASGTNAIIFESGKMKNRDMIYPGFFLKFICMAVTLFMLNTWGPIVLNMNSFQYNQTHNYFGEEMTTLKS
ncbi:Na(+)/citrate cotransporter-like [Oppia nitens]|uniref:Na(+)/citrate cotransporter-like n=1 Tax=Oppia nitens TaxID=1686743 RepID=UPI0023DBEFA2|nr:Na(+)/citrate cotransporter-like [Oppia nitens]